VSSSQILAFHAAASLPDSISGRRKLLGAILEVLPEREPLRATCRQMLIHLEQHERLQLELPLRKKEAA